MRALICTAVVGLLCSAGQGQTTSPLFARGYTVIPEPQRVMLGAADFPFDGSWRLQADTHLASDDVSLETLHDELSNRFHLKLSGSGEQSGVLSLEIAPGTVSVKTDAGAENAVAEEEAYRIDLHPGSIKVKANTNTGLFYGVETLIQMMHPNMGSLWLPEGTIEDWPDLQLRHIYWDDNHHLEHVDELKRDLRQAAFYKINGFVIKLNGHFQYKSAPAVVEPYALSPAELQELTTYGLRYHIQLIPYLDGPAHVHFILKHPEYSALREFPESDYELCATNPGTYKLMQGMYQDLMDANKGVKYFYLSTDEAYYAGLANNPQCNESALAKEKGSVGQVFVHFVDEAGGFLHDHGRNVIFWGEYPLKPKDLASLPPYLINGEVYGEEYDKAFKQQGIRQMIFTSTAGEEMMFPNYFLLPQKDRLHGDSHDLPVLQDMSKKISFDSARRNGTVIGEVDAGWADEGVNPETFWLGYVTSGAAAWHPGTLNEDEQASKFYTLFYGPQVESMDSVYRLMSQQAQMWSDSWDSTQSTARQGIWGWSYGIYKTRKPATDQTLRLPPVPGVDLSYTSNWASGNARRIQLALETQQRNVVLVGLINENMPRVQFNRYNLEVYLSIANLYGQNARMITGLQEMDAELAAASAKRNTHPEEAIGDIDHALSVARSIWLARNEVLQNAKMSWEKAWFPRVEEANGRQFLHTYDDVKDHLPDRTVDMSYLVYREKMLPFGEWVNAITKARNRFAAAHHLPRVENSIDWKDFTPAAPKCSSAVEILSTGQARPAHVDQAATCGIDQ
jgi:hexosaminidase